MKPLTTSKAFDSLSQATTAEKGDKALEKLNSRKTLKTSSTETDTVKLVKDGGAWLVDDLG